MKFRSPNRWHRQAGAFALLATLATSATRAETPKTTRTAKAAPSPQAVPATTAVTPATIVNEHLFTALNGQTPTKDLVVDGAGNVYGVTQSGGANTAGTVFRVNTDGTITTLHTFGTAANSRGVSADGSSPVAGLLAAPDGLLYGTTTSGGANNYGTVFSVNPGTGALTTLASFDSDATGYNSVAPLTTDGNGNFYGVAEYGYTNGDGAVFVYRTATGTLTALAAFDYNTTGRNPSGRLIFGADGNLYGTTTNGSNNGTVFQFNPATSVLTSVFNFNNSQTYGYAPTSGLATDGNGNFYGITPYGGTNGRGTVFELTENASANPPTFTPSVLYSFANANGNAVGYSPQGGPLIGTDGNLYGTTTSGGTNSEGTVFQLVLTQPGVVQGNQSAPGAATTFGSISALHTFSYTDGYGPNGTLTTDAAGDLYGTFPYGSTQAGGIFELTATATAGQYGFADLFQFQPPDGGQPFAGLTPGADGNLYGTTQHGGPNFSGTVFAYNPTTGVTTTLYNFFNEMFNGNTPVFDGNQPTGKLVAAANGVFYGTTSSGGMNGDGTIYQLTVSTDPATGALTGTVTSLYSFTNSGGNNADAIGTNAAQGDGYRPQAGLTLAADGNYYGTTSYGGANGDGTVYQFNPTTGAVVTEAAFSSNATGYQPNSPLVAAGNGFLYGMAQQGGANGKGAVFKYELATTTLSLVASFNGNNGSYPVGGLTLGADGFLYGTASESGPQEDGTLFQVDPAATTGAITTLVTFNGTNGQYPNSTLTQDADGNFYGTTQSGGANGEGTVYEYNPNTGAFVTLANFGFGAGFNPIGGLTLTGEGRLFGVTGGGYGGRGFFSDSVGPNGASAPSKASVKGVKAQARRPKAQVRPRALSTHAVTPDAVGGPLAVNDQNGTIYQVVITPTVSSSATAVGTVGTAFRFQVTGTSNPTAFTATGLPTGLSINAATGLITGTLTATGSFPVAVTVSNAGGTASQTLTIVVQPAPVTPPTVTSGAPPDGKVGAAYNYQITASNHPTSYGATGLPNGLTINPNTGLVSGTPTAAGSSSVTFSATNSGGTSSASYTLAITSGAPAITAPAITSAASANTVAGQPFSYQITASNNPTSYGATGLPAGLVVNPGTGLITGTSNTVGTYPVSLSATNAGGTGTATLTLTVSAQPVVTPVIGSAASTSGQVGQPFDYQVAASNNPTSYGATGLPDGLTINATTGLVSGTPTAAGSYSVSLSATNAGGTGTASLALTVTAAALQVPAIGGTVSASGQVAVAFTYQITASNSPVVYGAVGLPAGLVLNDRTGLISGTPTAAGTFAVTLIATNSAGSCTAPLNVTVATQPLPVITLIASVPSVTVGTGQLPSFALTRTGGDSTEKIAVNYAVAGSATAGVDYLALKGVKTFKPNKTTVQISVTLEDSQPITEKKTVKITLLPGDGYTLGTAITARVKILPAP